MPNDPNNPGDQPPIAGIPLSDIDESVLLEPDFDGPEYVEKLEPFDIFAKPQKSTLGSLFEAIPQRLLIWESSFDPPDLGNTAHWMGAQYNPTEYEAGVDTDWARFKSPGGHYAHMQFVAANNYTSEFELYFSAMTREELKRIQDCRNLLHKWLLPVYEHGWSLGPPRLWIEWPNSFKYQCYLVECKFKHLKFALDGSTTRFTAQVKFEEAADTFRQIGNASSPVYGLENGYLPPTTGKVKRGRNFRFGSEGGPSSNSVTGQKPVKRRGRNQ